jgi:CRP/FNR family transcriptional regulator
MNSAVQNIIVLNQSRHDRTSACQACARKSVCPAAGSESGSQVVQKVVQSGKTIYEAGGKFDGIYVVRSGFFKSYAIDADGVMQVTGFHLPGDFFGMDGIESGRYGDHVEALDTSSVCKLPLDLFNSTPRALQQDGTVEPAVLSLVKLMSRTIRGDRNMFFTLGKMSARRRLCVFLQDLSERMAQSGYSKTEFKLCMSRTDIANYLCLALETISRLFSQLQAEKIIAADRRNLRILDMAALLHDDEGHGGVRKAG